MAKPSGREQVEGLALAPPPARPPLNHRLIIWATEGRGNALPALRQTPPPTASGRLAL